MQNKRLAAFTLVEVSIVLVIIGLLVGGALAARTMMRNSEIRRVLSEYQNYTMAVQSFRDKYFALPGDMPNATKFWGALDADNAVCQTMAATDKRTCNGDGDGQIQGYNNANSEKFRFWQHLSNAGLIDGTYTGIKDSTAGAPPNGTFGVNAPASKVAGIGWIFENDGENTIGNGDNTAPIWQKKGERFHTFIAGTNYTAYNGKGGAAFTPAEAWEVDRKIDDGMPGTGILHSTIYLNCTDAANYNAYDTAKYKVSNTNIACAFAFPNALR